MRARTYLLDGNRTMRVEVVPDGWLVEVEGEANAQARGWPLEDLMEPPTTGLWKVTNLSSPITHNQTNLLSPQNYPYRGSFLSVRIGQS
jgi:hypothetical protein